MLNEYKNGKFEVKYGGKDYCYLTTADNLVTMFFNRDEKKAVIRRKNMVGMLYYNENQYDLILDEVSNSFNYNLDDFEDLWNEFWSYWNNKEKSVLNLQNENRVSNSKKALFGVYKDNQTFCLITSDNPMGKQYSAEENNKRREKFENDLKSIHRLYTKVKGAYGNEEKTFLIINITLTECIWLAKTYQQESFVFGNKENGKMIYHYFKTSDGKNYKDIERSDAIINQADADKFFTRINNFKFKMDFKFESVENMQKVFYERYSWNPKFEENFERYMKENMTIKHYYFENWFLMETKDHFMKRLERLTSSVNENLDESEVALYKELSQKEISDPKVYYMRNGIKFICRESQCKKRGIEDYNKIASDVMRYAENNEIIISKPVRIPGTKIILEKGDVIKFKRIEDVSDNVSVDVTIRIPCKNWLEQNKVFGICQILKDGMLVNDMTIHKFCTLNTFSTLRNDNVKNLSDTILNNEYGVCWTINHKSGVRKKDIDYEFKYSALKDFKKEIIYHSNNPFDRMGVIY